MRFVPGPAPLFAAFARRLACFRADEMHQSAPASSDPDAVGVQRLAATPPATVEDWDMKITTSEAREEIVELAKRLVAAEDEYAFDNIAEALVEEIQAADESESAEDEEEPSPEVTIEVFAMVNSEGDYEVGKDMEEVTERFEGYDVEAVDTHRWNITLPRPKVTKGEARITGEEPASVVIIKVE